MGNCFFILQHDANRLLKVKLGEIPLVKYSLTQHEAQISQPVISTWNILHNRKDVSQPQP